MTRDRVGTQAGRTVTDRRRQRPAAHVRCGANQTEAASGGGTPPSARRAAYLCGQAHDLSTALIDTPLVRTGYFFGRRLDAIAAIAAALARRHAVSGRRMPGSSRCAQRPASARQACRSDSGAPGACVRCSEGYRGWTMPLARGRGLQERLGKLGGRSRSSKRDRRPTQASALPALPTTECSFRDT